MRLVSPTVKVESSTVDEGRSMGPVFGNFSRNEEETVSVRCKF